MCALPGQTGLSRSSVQWYIRVFGLLPNRSKRYELSNDLFFVSKVQCIVGLYMSPPNNALLVLCVEEKSQCQALERT